MSIDLRTRIFELEELHCNLDYLARDLDILRIEFNVVEFERLLSKKFRSSLKRKITIRLRELKNNLAQVERYASNNK